MLWQFLSCFQYCNKCQISFYLLSQLLKPKGSFFFSFFFSFLSELHLWHRKFPGWGSN